MSPSAFYDLSIEEYRQHVLKVFDFSQADSSIRISRSHDSEVFAIEDRTQLQELLAEWQPHRAGLKLGQAVHHILEKSGSADRLVIVSDGDQFSWSDFNWKFLETKIEILHAPVRSLFSQASNIFIEDVEFVSEPDENTLRWEVEVAQTRAAALPSGILEVWANGEKLASKQWRMVDDQTSVTVLMEVYRSQLQQAGIQSNDDTPLTWRLKLPAGQRDGLAFDNEYRSQMTGIRQDVLLISEPQGEMFLEDPVHHLKIALEILGFDVKRLDRVPDKMDDRFYEYPLWVISGGGAGELSGFCPKDFAERRFASLRRGDGLVTGARTLPDIWLLPLHLQADYQSLCHCYATMVERDPGVMQSLPLYCEDVEGRDQYVSVLRSLGAKQIGGRVDRLLEAIAWHWQEDELDHEVLAFTLPLQPTPYTGLSYTQLPLLVQSLMEWMGFVQNQTRLKETEWPRINDISSTWAGDAVIAGTTVELSNVPRGESLLRHLNKAALPESWQSQNDLAYQSAQGLQEDQDPRPWIDLCLTILLALIAIEGLTVLGRSLWQLAKRRKEVTGIGLLLLGCGLGAGDSHAEVKLNLLDYPIKQFSADTLARDVASRTSIELAGKLQHQQYITDDLLSEGWIWVNRVDSITTTDGKLNSKVRSWLKRGGVLIVENLRSPAQLPLNWAGLRQDEGWRSIPPDHEIMRSFHLLDSLPECQGKVWQGFHFDDRIAVIGIPFSLLEGLLNDVNANPCLKQIGRERATRIFINIVMVALATDYKKDQIHLPEILKRLR
jgi:hypothetical protein